MSKMPVHVRYGHPRPSISAASFGPMSRTYTIPYPVDPGDELAYGQVRRISDGVFLLVLAPRPGIPAGWWDVMFLDQGGTEWAWESGTIQGQTAKWLRGLPLVTP